MVENNPYAKYALSAPPGGKDLMAENNPYAKYAPPVDTSVGEKTDLKQEIDPNKAYHESEQYKNESDFRQGGDIAFEKFGIGTAQLLSQMGTEQHNLGQLMPVVKNGKLSFGYPSREELAKRSQYLDSESDKLSTMGSVGETLLDPKLWAFPEMKSFAATMAVGGGVSAALSPSGDPEQTLLGRGFNTSLSSALSAVGGKTMEAAGHYVAEKTPAMAQAAGKKLYGMVEKLGPKAGEAIKSAGESVGNFAKKAIGSNTGAVSEPEALYKLADALGIKFTGKEGAKEVWENISTALLARKNEIAEGISKGSSNSSINKMVTNIAASKSYGEAKAMDTLLYDKAKALGEKEVVQVENILPGIKGLIENLEEQAKYSKDLSPNFGTTMAKLKGLAEKLEGGGAEEGSKKTLFENAQRFFGVSEEKAQAVTGADLIDIDQALNEHFGRDGFVGKSKKELENLQKIVQENIKKLSPELSKAYEAAKVHHIENIVYKFRDNPFLKDVWHPDDFRAISDMARGIKPSPEIKARVSKMIEHIDSFDKLQALGEQIMDPKTFDVVRSSVFLHQMEKAGMSAEKLGDKDTYNLLLKTVEHDPKAVATLDAMKAFIEEMNERGIKKAPTKVELESSNNRLNRAARTLFNFGHGNIPAGLQNAYRAVVGESKTLATKKLTNFAGEIAGGKPVADFVPGAATKAAGRLSATEIGETSPIENSP